MIGRGRRRRSAGGPGTRGFSSRPGFSRRRGFFVTGTGTGVGKTAVASAVARNAVTRGERVKVFKPAVSGLDEHAELGTEPDHELLRRAADSPQAEEDVAPYRYGPAVSPHLGAELAGEPIEREELHQAFARAFIGSDLLVCEGVGGLMVPLSLGYLVRDLAVDIGVPLLIAAPPGLGTINHTLLTIEAARAGGLEVAAVVLTPWPEEPDEVERSNRESIARLGEVTVCTLPRLDLADAFTWRAPEPNPLALLA